MTKKIVAIWAQDEEGVIGKENRLPWHLPAELQHFKETTLNHAILMGRVTFDGMGRRLLPKRETLILTRNPEEKIDGVATFQDVQSVLDWYQAQEKNLYIIGGKQIFQAFEAYLDEVIVTHIHARVEGDTYFPEELDLSLLRQFQANFTPKMRRILMILPSNTARERKFNGTEFIWSIHGFSVFHLLSGRSTSFS